jgi:hypothetical protein
MAIASPSHHSVGGSLVAMVLVTTVFGSALFSANNVLLELARASWHQIQLIQGSFDPTLDAQHLYQSASKTTALDKSGAGLPELVDPGKIKQYDGRIMKEASREHQLSLPPTPFFQGLPGSN